MPRPIIYKADQSPPVRAVMMVADLLSLNVDKRNLNPLAREQDTPEFVKKNPMRTIPIMDDGDFSIGDSHAIILYFLDKYGKPEHSYLYPEDKRKRAKVNQLLFFDCGMLFPRLRAVMAPTYGGKLTEMSKSMKRKIVEAYGMMEVYLEDTEYLADDIMTVADVSVFSTLSSLHGLIPVDEKRFPKLARWLSNMNEKDVCKRINKATCEAHVEGLKNLMEINKEYVKSKL